jgi:glycosyltransferase involved in cell wall biosynthesis
MEPFDVCMCTCSSSAHLQEVLMRIADIIPSSAINKKFIVDDFSIDNTIEIAEKSGWIVYRNKIKGLKNAQKYAISLISTSYYAMFQHDILLAENWFSVIPNKVINGKFDGLNGIRNRNIKGFREIDQYDNAHRSIISEDNSFYSAIPRGKRYFVNKNVVSIHIRDSVLKSLKHGFFIYKAVNDDRIIDLCKG